MQRCAVPASEHRQRAAAAFAALLLALTGALGTPALGAAATPDGAAAAQHLADTHGGSAADYRLVYERPTIIPESGARLWAGKFVDPHGEVLTVYRDASGNVGGPELLATGRRAALTARSAFDSKADAALLEAVAAASQAKPLPMAVWLAADESASVEAVIDRHPELT